MNDIEYVKNIISNFLIEITDLENITKWFKVNENTKNELKNKIYVEKIKNLYNNYEQISKNNGIYFVIASKSITKSDILDIVKLNNEKKYKGKLYKLPKLIEKYESIISYKYNNILYIGKAEGSNGLKERIKKYIQFGYGECKNHSGGRAIWQLKNNKDFYIACIECNNDTMDKKLSNKVESYLIKKYKINNFNNTQCTLNYPFANWRS